LQEVIKLRVDFRLFKNLRLTNKGGKDHFKALDLKMAFLGDDKSLIYELILALVSL